MSAPVSASSTPYRWGAIAAVLGVLLSVIAYGFSQKHEEARLRAHFERLAHDQAARLRNSLDQTLVSLVSIKGLFDASKQVTRDEFRLMVSPVLERHPEVMAINWAPRIQQSERLQFERSLLAEGLGERGIYDVTPDASQVRAAGKRVEYFPVAYSEPLEKNRAAIGIDPYARPQNREAMDAAMLQEKQWSTQPFAIVQDPQGPLSVAVYQPVYRQGMPPLITPNEHRAALRGFVILLLRPGILLDTTLTQLLPSGLDTRLLDLEHQPPLIHRHASRFANAETAAGETLQADYPLALPGRNWVLRITATQGFHARNGGNQALTVLFSGLSMSAALALLLWLREHQSEQQRRLAEELRESEQRLRQTFETNRAVKLIIAPADGRIVDANSSACNYYGYDRATLLGMRIEAINVLPKAAVQAEMHLAESEKRLYFNFRHRLASGEIRDVEVYSGPIETPQGRLLYSIVHDVTERKRAEEALRESESRFRQLADNIEAVFWIYTPDWQQVIYISPAYERIWGRGIERLQQNGSDWFDAIVEEDRPAVLASIPKPDQPDWQGFQFPPFRIQRPDREIRWISARAYPIRDETGRVARIAGLVEDVTERHTYQEHLEELAHFDPLTHLPNRRLLADRLRLNLAHSYRTGHLLAVCMLDLDGFKPVNDKYGHEVGDQLLIEVARRLLDSVRGDDTVARLGGDEFVILLGALGSVKELEEALRRLLHILALPYLIAEQPVAVSASIGVTLFPSDSGDADTLLRHADHAMYLAKEAGKNRFVLFNPALEERERDNRIALGLIRKAIAEDQLRLFYQPIVDCRRGLVVGMEALVRWEHPVLGLMGPAEFLPLVDGDDNLARGVGTWVLRHALQQADAWRQAGRDIPVSVNVFVQQLRDADFPDLLQSLLAEFPDLPASRLCIEILESTALDDFSCVTHLIHTSASKGVRFALDDFGTGFSSLTYLRRLPVNTLKIDQSFVRDMLQDPDNLAIVEGVIGLSTAFRHQVIAEGVESPDHALMLMEMGCYLVQGFGIAKPMPGEKTLDWIEFFQPDPRWLENAYQSLSRDDFQLVLAEVNHRQWLASLQSWTHRAPEHRGPPPPLDGHECKFGRWYFGEGVSRYGHLSEFRIAEALHERIHHLAQHLVQQTEHGELPGSRETETELLETAEEFRDILARIRSSVKHTDLGQ